VLDLYINGGKGMITINLDEHQIEQRFLEELRKRLDEIQHRHTFWDMKELCRQTKMSETFIRERFFTILVSQSIGSARNGCFRLENAKSSCSCG
jgi:hypothetical protein